MVFCNGESQHRLSGTVGWVHTAVGVATDDYEALKNKPRINGVELTGDRTLEQMGVVSFAKAIGDTIVIRVKTGG